MSTRELTTNNVEKTLDESSLVVIDAWAAWCGPCRAFAPIFEAASQRHADVVWAKLDTEAQPELAAALGIRALPTLLVFREGILVFQQAGMLPGSALDTLVQRARALDMDEVRKQIAQEQAKAQRAAG